MKFKDYLRSKTITLCFVFIAAIFTFILVALLDAGGALVICAEGLILVGAFTWLTISYILCTRRLKRIKAIASQMKEEYLLGEILPPPKNEIEAQYYEIMKRVSSSAIEMIERERRTKEEYSQYIEAWIHEIKTPLTACRLILENNGETYKLKRELKRADNLVESILYYARIKGPEKDTILRKFSVSQIINEAVKDEKELLIAAGISAEVNGDFDVISDDKWLGFIIKQLLVNSAKYCPSCHVKVSCAEGTIIYEDDGIGIPSYELSRVFDRGFTGTNGRNLGCSTGMGLYIVQELCRHLNVTLHIASEQGKYTKITLAYDSLTKV